MSACGQRCRRPVWALAAIVIFHCAGRTSLDGAPCAPADTRCDDHCASLYKDPENCGACGTLCSQGTVCYAGECATSCGGGTLQCGQSCVDPNVDRDNCGGCGIRCPNGEACVAEACTSTCASNQELCVLDGGAAYCASTESDNKNCGGCGIACDVHLACSLGACSPTCVGSQVFCTGDGGAYCANTNADNENCGACGHVCEDMTTCVNGACVVPCPLSGVLCDGTCIDPKTSPSHCGASVNCDADAGTAGTDCGDESACVNGGCMALTTDRIIFVSSTTFSGNLGGLSGADGHCQNLATGAALPGSYKAWLSDGTNTAVARLKHSTGNYVLADRSTIVAQGWTGLTSGTLLHAIDMTETGKSPPMMTYCTSTCPLVYTNTAPDGTMALASYDCANWTGGGGYVLWGCANTTNLTWTQYCRGLATTSWCDGTYPALLYCVQQ